MKFLFPLEVQWEKKIKYGSTRHKICSRAADCKYFSRQSAKSASFVRIWLNYFSFSNLKIIFFHFSYLIFNLKKIAGLDLNERKGSNRYVPPHLRGGESDSTSSSLKDNDINQGSSSNSFKEGFSNNRGGGADRDFNNRWVK